MCQSFVGLALGTGLVAIGQLLISPVQSTVTARLGGGKGGAYFGVGSLALAVGGALGNGSGGALIDISARVGLAWLPWIGMCGVAIVSAIGFALLQRDTRFQKRLAGHPLTFGGQRVPLGPAAPTEAADVARAMLKH